MELQNIGSAAGLAASEKAPVRLNIGAGGKVLEGWTSVGLDPHHEIQCDIRQIPLPDNTADEAMAIHVIEHLYFWDVPAALLEWKRVLKPGAWIAIECPDLLKCCRNVVDGLPARMGVMGIYGDPVHQDPLMLHKWLPTAGQMKKLLMTAGFEHIKSKAPLYHGKRVDRDMRMTARKP